MKTLPEILRQHWFNYIDAEHKIKGNNADRLRYADEEALEAIAKELMGIIGEDEPFEFKDGRAIPMMVEEAWKNGRNNLRAEQRARLTAFIGKENK